MSFEKIMQLLQAGQAKTPTKDGQSSSILGSDNLSGSEKLTSTLGVLSQGGSLINTNAKDAGGHTDVSSAAVSGAQKGAAIGGGPVGAAIGAVVGAAKGFQNRRTELRNNTAQFEQAGRQQAADSYSAFDRVIGGLK